MNQHFELFKEKCTVPTRWDGEKSRFIDSHLDLDKYSQMIVSECANYLEKNGGMVEVAMELKRHFGIST
jgi:hypothetical protein